MSGYVARQKIEKKNGQMLLAWILQYTRSQPRMIKVCWEFDVDTFAGFE